MPADDAGHAVHGEALAALEALMRYDFPGNIRELENLVERLVAVRLRIHGSSGATTRSSERRRSASSSQSVASATSRRTLPEVSPLRHRRSRDREWKWTSPVSIVAARGSRFGAFRRQVFDFMHRNALPATEFFRIPSDRVVELGVQVAI